MYKRQEGERLRRYQQAIRRELTRTLDQLARLRALQSKHAFTSSHDGIDEDVAGDASPPGADPDAPNEAKSGPRDGANEAKSTAAVQAPFTFERDRAAGPDGAKGPSLFNRPRTMAKRDKAAARMLKKARKGR